MSYANIIFSFDIKQKGKASLLEKGLVSIVLPTHNRGYVIEKAINSVKSQTYSGWELIVVDDGSTDSTQEIFSRETDSRIHYVYNYQNNGANFARNTGCKLAKGEYLAFIDSDNIWNERKLACQIFEINDKNKDICYCKIKTVNGRLDTINPNKCLNPDELLSVIKRRNIIDLNSLLLRNDKCIGKKLFDEKMPRLQDWDLLFRLLLIEKFSICGIDEILGINIVQNDSISKDDNKYKKAVFHFALKYQDLLSDEEIVGLLISLLKIASAGYEEITKECVNELYRKQEITYLLNYEMSKSVADMHYREKIINAIIFDSWNPEKLINKNIAIYGLGKLGNVVYDKMSKFNINIIYGIDRSVNSFYNIPIKRIGDELAGVDAIFIAVLNNYKEIEEELKSVYKCEIITFGDI